MISTILGGLALLAAVTCLTLFFQEKKRNEKRRAAMIQLQKNGQEDLASQIEVLKEATEKRLRDLEAGVIPDYAAARQAADAVDSFNQGLSNILGFDPMEVARKARESAGGDG